MSTFKETYELRIKFLLRSSVSAQYPNVEETTRTLTVPLFGNDSERQTAVLNAIKNFRRLIVGVPIGDANYDYWFDNFVTLRTFVQPTSYLDNTGSSGGQQPERTYTTYGLEAEIVQTQQQTWTDSDISE